MRDTLREYLEAFDTETLTHLGMIAEPLFALMDLSPGDLEEARLLPEEAAACCTFLAMARLVQAYLALPEAEQARAYPLLLDFMTDPSMDGEGREEMAELLDELIQRARRLPLPEDLPSFFLLLEQWGSETFSEETSEQLAFFAEPLLARCDLCDEGAFERAMELASAYWQLAQCPPETYDETLARIQGRFARSPEEARALAEEARQMVARYHALFSRQNA